MSTEHMEEETETISKGNGRNPIIILGGFILLGLALTLLLFGSTLFNTTDTESPVFEQVPALNEGDAVRPTLPAGNGEALLVGDKAHDFALQDLDGNEVQLSSFAGQPVIVNFWATWCAPCRIEMPELQAAFEENADNNLVILAVDQQEPPDVVREFFYNQMELTFTPLLDTESAISDLYGTGMVYPTTYFLNPEGEVTAVHRGPMTKSQIDGYLAETIPTG